MGERFRALNGSWRVALDDRPPDNLLAQIGVEIAKDTHLPRWPSKEGISSSYSTCLILAAASRLAVDADVSLDLLTQVGMRLSGELTGNRD